MTGMLVPMPHVTTGNQVVGIVNVDGLSATFAGISHLSILVGLLPDVIQVSLDIKPNTLPNPVNTKSRGKIPVAILSTDSFDAVAAVDHTTLTFGRTGDEISLSHCNVNGEDVNDDGLNDLVCHFYTQSSGFMSGDTEGFLKGQTWANENLLGTDTVRIVN